MDTASSQVFQSGHAGLVHTGKSVRSQWNFLGGNTVSSKMFSFKMGCCHLESGLHYWLYVTVRAAEMFSHQTKFHLIKSTNCQPRTSSIRRQRFPKEVQFRTWRESVILLESSNPSVSKSTLFGGQITHFSAFFRSSSQILSTRLFEPKGVHSHVYIIWRINFRLSRDGVDVNWIYVREPDYSRLPIVLYTRCT